MMKLEGWGQLWNDEMYVYVYVYAYILSVN